MIVVLKYVVWAEYCHPLMSVVFGMLIAATINQLVGLLRCLLTCYSHISSILVSRLWFLVLVGQICKPLVLVFDFEFKRK
jgi:type III secretory pathway component EscU